ncbi:MAG TPA: twin-arginine translocase TatA/TatE family subunit [Nitrosopumilaceae archaeon]|nr:twin-arginine translocase TatA/TatE family subunit [Nitrosopumilaceae archaeon]
MLDFSLDIIGNEWIIIAFVAIILFLGPKRLPDVSRKIGKLMGEYNKTKNMVQNELQKATTSYNLSIQGPVETERQKLETIAKSLGIDYINKTDDELKNLIASKMGTSQSSQGTDNSTP